MFRTELSIAPATSQLPRMARVLTVGSCFADSIGSRLAANKVETLINPFGTVFQPLALTKLLRAAAGEDVDWQQHLVEARGRWQSYDLHGSIGADSPVELLLIIQELVRRTGEFLRQADLALLTLGTAWAYRLRETGELVSNCHKQSADLFVRELLTPDEIINNLAETHAYLRRINPELRFVLTVSPVRHLKDTLPLNSVSKSVLRLATHIVSDLLPGVAYFPAYELLVDDLRDYRFYASDMLHPSEVAEDYIWEKFARTYFDADFGRFRKEWAAVRQSLGHRPLHAGAPEHREFLESTREKLEQLSLRKVEVAAELNQVRTQLAALPIPRQPEPIVFPEDDEERIDIGEGTATTMVTEAAQLEAALSGSTEGRPPRLSPEEFRAQRGARSGRPEQGRRDGRGKGQREAPTENEQFQNAATLDNEQPAAPDIINPATLVTVADSERVEPVINSTTVSATPTLDAAVESEESAKPKKRRSRGGAKRTARKNALRLAAGELPADTDTSASMTATGEAVAPGIGNEPQATPSERPESSVIIKSMPVQRGGRRNESGRVPRVELFAAAPVVSAASAPLLTNEESSAVVASVAPTTPEAAAPLTSSRNNRNRKNRGAAKAEASNAATNFVTAAPMPIEAGYSVESNQAVPLVSTTNESANEVPTPAAPAKANKSNRAKRMVSAARMEKPAIDVPVIPVNDAQPRTQVAAGRMMGTSASLVAPTIANTPAKTTIAAKTQSRKPVVAKVSGAKPAAVAAPAPTAPAVAAGPVVTVKSKSTPKPKAAPLRAATGKTTASKAVTLKPATPSKVQARAVEMPIIEAPKVAAAKKAAAKPPVAPIVKIAVAKPTAKKPAAAKPTTAKPVAAKPAAIKPPKPAAAKPVAAKPTVPRAKTPKKPTKPA